MSIIFVDGNISSILEWLEHSTTIVKSPNLHHTPRLPPDMSRILREDKDFWYNIRLSPDSKYGMTVTSKAMFP